jgi:glycerol-3-phosphate acyltransferase PlsY
MIYIYLISAYLIGSIPIGYLLYHLIEKKDIRNLGSQSTGATNVLRLKGWRYAIPVAVLDILKGYLPVFFALHFLKNEKIAFIGAFLAVLGHCFPVYIKFKGGKGVATAIGAFAGIALIPLLFCLPVFIITILLTRYVSLGSLMALLSFPVLNALLGFGTGPIVLGTAVFFVSGFRHWGNILRLIQGTERKIGEKIS